MNNIEISNYLSSDEYTKRYFQGVVAYDELSLYEKPMGLYVVNTDISTGPGIHWVCVLIGENCEYFDSLGKPPSVVKNFLDKQNKPYIFSSKKLQGDKSDVCGDYCLLYSYFRCRGLSMKDFINIFSNDTVYNDSIVEM